jgi:diaminopimelate epimerase
MSLSFSKYSGSGNDFILIDNRGSSFPCENSLLIQQLCRRPQGIGADGLILLENASEADYGMRIFNADGGEAEMCGNGIRCLLLFIKEVAEQKDSYTIKTFREKLTLSSDREFIKTSMPVPTHIRWNETLEVGSEELTFHFLNTGVPHVVIFVDDLQDPHWMSLASSIRYHPSFAPQGTNVNFVHVDERGQVHLRTYERGVEQETGACGTGATAAALASNKIYGLKSPIQLLPSSQELLWVSFEQKSSSSYQDVYLTGSAHLIFRGEYDVNADLKPCCPSSQNAFRTQRSL